MSGGRRWVLLGGGGHATSITAILHRLGDEVVGASNPEGDGRFTSDAEALAWAAAEGASVVPAVGDAHVRDRMLRAAHDAGVAAPAVVAATAVVTPGATLGEGAVVAETSVLGPGAVVERGAVVNTGAIVEHHARVGAFTHVAPRAVLLGAATVGTHCLIGAGAVVLPGRHVGDGATVGANAVVTADVAPGDTVVGAPARSTGADRRKVQG